MRIRTADVEQTLRAPGVTSRLSVAARPLGGDFGVVRSHNHKNHQGWDLYAAVGTPIYAIVPAQSSSLLTMATTDDNYALSSKAAR
jgi:murein DD-endopeptidase MepM/ murein hydrolase activator NlpD